MTPHLLRSSSILPTIIVLPMLVCQIGCFRDESLGSSTVTDIDEAIHASGQLAPI